MFSDNARTAKVAAQVKSTYEVSHDIFTAHELKQQAVF